MSDYGASLIISKKDKIAFTAIETEQLKKELERIKNDNEFSDALGEDFLFDLHEISNEKFRLFVVLSKYWYGEGTDEENFEFAKDNDLGQVEEIVMQLQPVFDDIFDVEAAFENW